MTSFDISSAVAGAAEKNGLRRKAEVAGSLLASDESLIRLLSKPYAQSEEGFKDGRKVWRFFGFSCSPGFSPIPKY